MATVQVPETYEGVCPSCGQWLVLDEATGFCYSCTAETSGLSLCNRCHTNTVALGSTLCQDCKYEAFLSNNADTIESFMATGCSFSASVLQTRNLLRPTCLSCGGFIYGARRDALFCKKHKKCRSARRRMRTLHDHFKRKGYTNPYNTALEQIKLELSE